MGFLFLVLYPLLVLLLLPVLPPHSHTHTHTHTLTHSHSLTHTLTHSHTHTHSLTHSHTHSLTHSHTLTHSLSPSLTHTHPPLLRGRRGTMCTAKGSDVRPGVPWVSASFAWQAWHNVHCQGVGCTPWRPLGLRLFCVAGVAQCALPRGRMYALASLGSPPLLRGRRGTMCTAKGSDVRPGVPWVSASFAWQAWHNVHLTHSLTHTLTHSLTHTHTHSLTHTLTHSLSHSLTHTHPPLLRGRRGTMCTAKGSDVRPGVPWVSASFAWQAWHNVHCQGVGCTPWRPLGLRLFCVAGVAQCALPRGRMYALASLGSPPLLRGRRGTMCTAKGSDVRPGVPWVSASFAWQAWHNVHCQGVGCTPWRPLGLRRFCVAGVAQCEQPRGRMYALASLGSPPLLRGRRGTMCTAKGSDVRPGVPWVSASFAWQAWHNVHCQGVGCTPWRPLGLRLFCVAGVAQCALPRGRMYALASLGSPPLLRGRRGTMCTAKGSDVRPGVPWVSASFAWQAWHNVHCQGVGCTPWRPLGLRRFCVAGVAQCEQPRGRMYALASLGSPPLLRGRRGTMCTAKGSDVRPGVPWVSASFAWQAWHNVLLPHLVAVMRLEFITKRWIQPRIRVSVQGTVRTQDRPCKFCRSVMLLCICVFVRPGPRALVGGRER